MNENCQSHHRFDELGLTEAFFQSKDSAVKYVFVLQSSSSSHCKSILRISCVTSFSVRVWGFGLACWFWFSQNGQGRERERLGSTEGESERNEIKRKR